MALYTMSGVHHDVELKDRLGVLSKFADEARASLRETSYTTTRKVEKLKQKIEELQDKKDNIDRLHAMGEENFLKQWLAGER